MSPLAVAHHVPLSCSNRYAQGTMPPRSNCGEAIKKDKHKHKHTHMHAHAEILRRCCWPRSRPLAAPGAPPLRLRAPLPLLPTQHAATCSATPPGVPALSSDGQQVLGRRHQCASRCPALLSGLRLKNCPAPLSSRAPYGLYCPSPRLAAQPEALATAAPWTPPPLSPNRAGSQPGSRQAGSELGWLLFDVHSFGDLHLLHDVLSLLGMPPAGQPVIE